VTKVYNYGDNLLKKFPDIKQRLAEGRMIPHEVEIHPPPIGEAPCWLRCKHCFTQTKFEQEEKIPKDRLIEIIHQIGEGSPKTGEKPEKIILVGFRTDPLNSLAIEGAVQAVKDKGMALGVATKGLRISNELANLLTKRNERGDYITFSIDAGNSATYNEVHGVGHSTARLYERVLANICRLVEYRSRHQSPLKIRATYLLTDDNANSQVLQFIEDFLSIGVDTVRFSVPIVPKMGSQDRETWHYPLSEERLQEVEKLILPRVEEDKRVIYLDFEGNTEKVMPCYHRWIAPAVGYDGYLYPCCLVSSQEFDDLRIADLKETDFWDAYYSDIRLCFANVNCQCSRPSADMNLAVKRKM
jgi:MoaA/NifB/PqqE/SkfB family radical SAM enzyme